MIKSYTEEFIQRVIKHINQPTAKGGVPWPKDPLQRWILAWLECKADDFYTWPRWAVAEEATNAMYAYHEIRSSDSFT